MTNSPWEMVLCQCEGTWFKFRGFYKCKNSLPYERWYRLIRAAQSNGMKWQNKCPWKDLNLFFLHVKWCHVTSLGSFAAPSLSRLWHIQGTGRLKLSFYFLDFGDIKPRFSHHWTQCCWFPLEFTSLIPWGYHDHFLGLHRYLLFLIIRSEKLFWRAGA